MATQEDDGRIRRRYGSILSRRPLPITHVRGAGEEQPGLFARFAHLWRYGSYHPDEDLLGVIDAAVDSLTAQIKAAEGILTGARLERLHAVRQELNVELQDEVPELAVLLGIEAKINALYPPAVQRRRAWIIEERFRRVASGHAADYWAADRSENRLAEQFAAQLDGAEDAIAAAEAAATAAGTAADAAAAELQAAQAAFQAALGGESEEAATPELDQLQALSASDPNGEATQALQAKRGPLLDARTRLRAAEAAGPAAEAAKTGAAWTLEHARLQRAVVEARFEVERIQARLRGSNRAVGDLPGGTAGASGGAAETNDGLSAAEARVVAASDALKAHEASRPEGVPAPAAEADAAAGAGSAGPALPFDSDAQSLLGYIHSAYLMGIARERAVRDLMRWLMMRFWTANLIFLLSLFAAWGLVKLMTEDGYRYHALIAGLFVIAVIGRIGATMSVVQRLQKAVSTNVLANDPIQELTRLRTGKNGINVALFSGGIFALLMYVLFASGIPAILGLDDGAAPAISTIQRQEQMQLEQRLRSENIAARAREAAAQADRVRALEQRAASAAVGTGTGGGQPAVDPAQSAALRVELEQERARLDELRRTAVEFAAADPGAGAASPPSGNTEPVTDGALEPTENGTADANSSAEVEAGSDNAVAPLLRSQAPGSEPAAAPDVNGAETAPASQDNQAAEATNAAAGNAAEGNAAGAAGGSTAGPKPAGGAAPGGAVPEQCMAKDSCDPFVLLADALGLADREDFFKLLIWAFLAGFAERLVPDALDAIARRGRRRQRTGGEGEETA
ncbi:MAG TPA: hypothetical protein VF552_04060 [Allosphingosinicella sp.]